MANFAIIEDEKVTNIIVADSKTIAEEVTGKTCVQFTTEPAEVGGTYVNKKFIRRKPYHSWVSDGDSGWNPPVDYPDFNSEDPKYYEWNESTTSWDLLP